MARELPKAQKIYTTRYDNFRGVDFTNDATNVWSHRSPNAVNMMPDLAGRPWKRTGWKIEKTTQDFKDCYNTAKGYIDTDPDYYTGRVVPQKTNYFGIGGEDYLAITNNLGLFFYSKFIGNKAADSAYLMFIDGYYGEIGTTTESTKTTAVIVPDPNRAFFFEGGGTAGFYIFCTISTTTSLFRFDGEVLRKVDPKIPLIMYAKGAGDAAGTLYESPNILTLERMVMFEADGSSKDYVLPEKAATVSKVEVASGGSWTTKTAVTDYNTANYSYGGTTVTKVSFTNAPAAPDVTGEDNIRVTYSISGNAASTTISTKQGVIGIGIRKKQNCTTTITKRNGQVMSSNSTPWVTVETSTVRQSFSSVIPNIVMTDNEPTISAYLKSDENTWSGTALSSLLLESYYSAYTNTLTVNCKDGTGYYYTEAEPEYSSVTQISSNVSKLEPVHGQGNSEIIAFGVDEETMTTIVEQRYVTEWKWFPIKVVATVRTYSGSPARNAFESCIRAHVYGDGIINSVFMAGSTVDAYRSRVWWSATSDPTYFPDTNYFEVGSNDTRIAGLIDVGENLGIIKQGQSINSTIYLAYQTKIASGTLTTDTGTETTYDVTYGVKTSIGGIGAISNGAFNILNGEPLFLSKEGVMGIVPANENEKQIRNRSFFVNKKLLAEPNLDSAFSFVWRNMYILAVNHHCYILDGSQKSSWANEKTNLQYEAYYWENIPAQCFARYGGKLWFTDYDGRLCRFKEEGVSASYHDEYDASVPVESNATPIGEANVTYGYIPVSVICSNDQVKVNIDTDVFWTAVAQAGSYVFELTSAGYLHRTHFGHHFGNAGHLDTTATIGTRTRSGDSITMYYHNSEGWHLNGAPINIANYGISFADDSGDPRLNDSITIMAGAPIGAKWTTVFDDDGSAHYFKTLQKKGTMVVLYPQSSTGVKVYIKKDNAEPLFVGTATVRGSNNEITAPSDFYLRKKAKKYKRLQIITENNGFDETFGIDEIIKCFTLGNYSRNR